MTPEHPDTLLDIAATENRGKPVPFVSRALRALRDQGLITITVKADTAGARVRCTPEGLEAAREIREREDVA